MQEFFFAVISFFLIEPLQSAMTDRFGNISREQFAGVTSCIREATPVLVGQVTNDPWQTATHVFGIWSGTTPPEDILAATTPGCAETVRSLEGAGAQAES
ncbi:hypothetical protein Sa4125_05590 [Aureimonas sp. SA4125]|uniref:hypothetical protein n=1 Tax=Aureimonas sp. SA4125 TaxID=2826993 RepID=UPI001CC46FDC|nr:hypothetical protein [Aureimonas sp. SA4125]BDA83017.1 hypothetical protein Sa4125_05590 [Aureimonas sp. SA4125]